MRAFSLTPLRAPGAERVRRVAHDGDRGRTGVPLTVSAGSGAEVPRTDGADPLAPAAPADDVRERNAARAAKPFVPAAAKY